MWIDDESACPCKSTDNNDSTSLPDGNAQSVANHSNPPAPNNSMHPVPSRLPKARRGSRRKRWLLAALAVFVLGGSSLGGWLFYSPKHAARPDLILDTIKKETLHVTITERGSLEPTDNIYITCKVKAKTPGQACTSIRWVIDNGSLVKEGDRVLELDDAGLQEQLQQQQIEVYKAEEAWEKAKLLLTKDVLSNKAVVEQWKTKRHVAEMVLKEYLEGQFANARLDLQNKRIMSDSDLAMWEERELVGTDVASGAAICHDRPGRSRRRTPSNRRPHAEEHSHSARGPREGDPNEVRNPISGRHRRGRAAGGARRGNPGKNPYFG